MIIQMYVKTLTIKIGEEIAIINVPDYDTPYVIAMDKNGELHMYDVMPEKLDNSYDNFPNSNYCHIATYNNGDAEKYFDTIIEVDMFDTIIDFNKGIAE